MYQWLESNPGAKEEDARAKQKEIEAVANPIISRCVPWTNVVVNVGVVFGSCKRMWACLGLTKKHFFVSN